MSGNGIFLSLGSNLGERQNNIKQALIMLENHRDIIILKESSIYETKPYGVIEQNDFLNIAIKINTSCSPEDLLRKVKWIEKKIGRIQGERWGPRIVDIDILFYHQLVFNSKDLIIPHLDLQNRDFVLVPMVEIAPDFIHPIFNMNMQQLLANFYIKYNQPVSF